jgi:hypothetical protein
MAFFKKKKPEDEFAAMPETEDLPPLPPLPGEEEIMAPEPLPRQPRLRPAAPEMPEITMAAPPTAKWTAPMAPAAADKATVFVRLDKYRDIMRMVEEMEAKIAELNTSLERISSIKQKEGEIIDGWHAMLSEAKSRIDTVSAKLTRPEA